MGTKNEYTRQNHVPGLAMFFSIFPLAVKHQNWEIYLVEMQIMRLWTFETLAAWWFGTCFVSIQLGIVIPTDSYFSEGRLNHQPDKDLAMG